MTGFDIGEAFADVHSFQERQQLESKVLELTAQVDRLKQLGESPNEEISQLTGLLAKGGLLEIPLTSISPNAEQPRKTFTEDSIKSLANSLAEDGQQEPIILINMGKDGDYLLFDGERRWRAAMLLKWRSLLAVVIPEPAKLHRRVLVANLHREGLNSLDVAEALIREIESTTGLNEGEIISAVRNAVRRLQRNNKNDVLTSLVPEPSDVQAATLAELSELSESERAVLKILLSLRLNPASVSTATFRMLQFPPDLKQAIREQGLPGFHALDVARLSSKALGISEKKSEKLRSKVVGKILQDKLTQAETKKLVAEYLPQKSPPPKTATAIVKTITDFNPQGLNEEDKQALREVLQAKLEELQ